MLPHIAPWVRAIIFMANVIIKVGEALHPLFNKRRDVSSRAIISKRHLFHPDDRDQT